MTDSGMTSDQNAARASQKASGPAGRLLSSFLVSCRACRMPAPLARAATARLASAALC